jgi:methionine-rich copper-binding protein CopC
MIRTVRRVTAVAVSTLAVLAAAPAAKHVHLTRSEPSSDSTVTAAPSAIRLWFSGAVQLAVTTVRLTGPDGAAVATAPPRAGEDAVVVIEVRGSLKPGRQRVRWRTMSRDGHPVAGEFAFRFAPAVPPAR